MPATTSSTGVADVKPASTASKRFELPLLDFKFGSLTDGTNIPPPLPSPKEEARTQPKTPSKDEVPKKQEASGVANGHGTFPKSDVLSTTNGGIKRPADETPASPTLSSRGSLRRLLSKTLLNNAYDEQGSISGQGVSRPPSRTASTIAEDRKVKRSSGWFRRLRSNDRANDRANDSQRASTPTFVEEVKTPKKAMGPPPPMIPELSALESKVDTNLGDDLFKSIGK
ncbi:Uu.00g116520.m01.CDS01 [Anthostomella pinea]|uniref:Uu.00g116520.m01.CDS01 n=1 Tax=Anthostomella pinea TaxID=933095 RepID=A0AAI8YEF2_9PEZI|nr:Uu.00g116520.m01.CDS01 [Anthostomella pinea]